MRKATSEAEIANQHIYGENFRIEVLNRYFADQPSTLPKAARLYEACLKMIENCYWSPGDRVPSEQELSQSLPVGLSTVQTALGRLASNGLIHRRRKAGSFISDPAAAGRELAYFLFLDQESDAYLSFLDIKVRTFETREQGDWSGFVGSLPKYICIERVMEFAGEFRIHNRIYLGDPKFRPLLNFPEFELRDLSFRILFQDRCVRFTRLDEGLAETLERPLGSPALQYDIRQFTVRNEPLFFMRTIIPENNRTLRISAQSTQ
jgi:GntR family transcriptional regulator